MSIKTNNESTPNYVPQFPQNWGGSIYPYPMLTNIDHRLIEKEFKVLYIENEYLKVSVLPEYGGHIYSCMDKLTGEQMIWDNPELKKELIGRAGAWCAFGAEINFPIVGHIPTTVSPVNYALQKLPDGGAAIVVSDMEYLADMKWTLKAVLRPKSPRLEVQMILYNPTGFSHPLYYWLNVAVRANQNVRVVFPNYLSTTHGSPWIRPWPVEEDVDLSWYRNHKQNVVSRFGRDDLENFMGYYDYQCDFGAFHWADRGDLPYRKFWSWGQNRYGKSRNQALTETYGDYVELQSGLFKDQETSGFFGPHATSFLTHYWMPVRKIGGFQYGSLDAALSLEVDTTANDDRITFGANTYESTKAGFLELYAGDSLLVSHLVDMGPNKTHRFEHVMPRQEKKYRVSLLKRDREQILGYSQDGYRQANELSIGDIDWPRVRGDERQSEDYYYEGKQQEVAFNYPRALERFNQGLKKSPHSLLLNKAKAEVLLKKGDPEEAYSCLKKAAHHHLNDPEVDYLYALYYTQIGKQDRAEEYFRRCIRLMVFPGASHYQTGLINARRNEWGKAYHHFSRAMQINPKDVLAIAMTAWAENRLGNKKEALALAERALELDPTCVMAFLLLPEKHAVRRKTGHIIRPEFKQHQYLVSNLHSIGEYGKAYEWLKQHPINSDPMYCYYLAWLAEKTEKSPGPYLAKAAQCDLMNVYPHTQLDREVLEFVIKRNAEDAHALHLLGLLRISKGDNEKGIGLLERAVSNPKHSAHSNFVLAMLYKKHDKPLDQIEAQLKEALKKMPGMQYAAVMHANIEKQQKKPVAEWLETLLKAKKTLSGKSIQELDKTIILAYMEMGNYAMAADVMRKGEFYSWEGGHGIRPYWWNNYLLWARSLAEKGSIMDALAKIDTSLIFPANLQAEASDFGLEQYENEYLKGQLYSLQGEKEKAGKAFTRSAEWISVRNQSYQQYASYYHIYQILSLKKIGRDREAKKILERIKQRTRRRRREIDMLTFVLFTHITEGRKKGEKAAKDFIQKNNMDITTLLAQEYLAGRLIK